MKDLTPGTHGHNLVLRVVNVAPTTEKKRYDGTTSRIAEAILADETGCVTFTARNGARVACLSPLPRTSFGLLWLLVFSLAAPSVCAHVYSDQIELLHEGAVLVVRNSNADIFNGFMRLNVTQWGKLAPHPDGVASTPKAPVDMNTDNNVSSVEYELVTVEDEGDE